MILKLYRNYRSEPPTCVHVEDPEPGLRTLVLDCPFHGHDRPVCVVRLNTLKFVCHRCDAEGCSWTMVYPPPIAADISGFVSEQVCGARQQSRPATTVLM